MKNINNIFTRNLAKLPIIFLLSALLISCSQTPSESLLKDNFKFIIGTYSVDTASIGIYSLQLNPNSGQFSQTKVVVKSENPSFLLYQAGSKILYAVNEVEKGSISVFEQQDNHFKLAQKLDLQGEYPCHLNLVNDGNYLGVANYKSGNVSLFRRDKSGKLDENSLLTVSHHETGANIERQVTNHAHWVGETNSEYIYSVDLGADKIFKYKLDSKGKLTNIETALQLNPGDGPRHIEKHPSKNIIYLVNALSNTVAVLSVQGDGNLSEKQRINILPAGNTVHSQAAAIKLDKTANYLYVTNRGHNSITTYKVLDNGDLQWLSNVYSKGIWPRDLLITDDNQFMLVANQHSNSINLFRIDQNSGEPIATEEVITVPSPTNIIKH